jgi:RNA polymerase sigma-70 factor (ECF subfamily)
MSSVEDSDGPHTLPASLDDLSALCGLQYEMPPTLKTFYRTFARPQLRYAMTVLGDKEAAKTVVRRLYRHLAMRWAAVLLDDGAEVYAWRTLKLLVDQAARAALAGDARSTALAARDRTTATALYAAAGAILDAMRAHMADHESPAGLYTALAALPERQFDVILLHYELGYTSNEIADIMGILPGTVRTHRRLARERIAARLGIDLSDDEERE